MPPKKRGSGRRGDRRAEAAPLAEEGQEYARVMAMLGNNRVRARFGDKSERLCRIRGSMRRRMWVNVGDIVLVAQRDELSGEVGDIVYRYQPADVQRLRRLGEPMHIAGDEEEERMDETITFAGGDDDDGGGEDGRAPWRPFDVVVAGCSTDDDHDDDDDDDGFVNDI